MVCVVIVYMFTVVFYTGMVCVVIINVYQCFIQEWFVLSLLTFIIVFYTGMVCVVIINIYHSVLYRNGLCCHY